MVLVGVMTVLLCVAVYVKTKPANSSQPNQPFPVAPVTPQPQPTPEPIPDTTPKKVAPRTVNTYAEALTASKESGCNIFLYFGAPWCGYCEQMKSTTLVNSEVTEKLSKNFVVLIINTDEDKATARKFGVRGIPAYMVVNSEGNVLRKTTGYKPAKEFLKWLGDK